MKILNFLIVSLFLFCSSFAMGQSKALSKANKLYKEKQFSEAIPYFETALEEGPSHSLRTKLAFCYKAVNNLEKAEAQYSVLVYDERVRPISFKRYGETLMSSGKYAAAKFWLEEYLKSKPDDAQAKVLLESCDLVYTIKPHFPEVELLDYPFNSEFDDNSPIMVGERLFFSSDRGGKGKTDSDGRGYMGVYESSKNDQSWDEPQMIPGKVNGSNSNSGPISFTADGKMAVFCKNAPVPNKKGKYPLQIYFSSIEEGKIKENQRFPFCKLDVNYYQATISQDGSEIIFSSDRGGGQGKADLYHSQKQGVKWSAPKNMGPIINSGESEGFPLLDQDGKLYFCSKGRLGFGGFDLYLTEKDGTGEWKEPINLGYPINSSGDEMSIFVNADNQSGVLSSTRISGTDDLFLFNQKAEEEMIAQVDDEDAIPEFAKAEIARRETEKERMKEEKENKKLAEAREKANAEQEAIARAEALAIEKAEQEALAKVEAEQAALIKAEALAREKMEAEAAVANAETATEKDDEIFTINKQSEEAIEEKFKSDTIYIGKRLENKEEVVKTEPVVNRIEMDSKIVTAEIEKTIPEDSLKEDMQEKVQEVVAVAKVKKEKKNNNKKRKEKETELAAIEEIQKTESTLPVVKEEVVETSEDPIKEEVNIAPVVETAPVVEPEVEIVKEEVVTEKTLKDKVKKSKGKTSRKKEVVAVAEKKEIEIPRNEKPSVEKDMVSTKVKDVKETRKNVAFNNASELPKKASSIQGVLELANDLKNKEASSEKKYNLADLKYKFNATEITSDLEDPLNKLATIMKEEPNLKFILVGHTASIGGDEKNQRLSVARAAAAVDYLVRKGVNPNQLSFEGRGETELINECHDGVLCGRTQHQENERIEIQIQ